MLTLATRSRFALSALALCLAGTLPGSAPAQFLGMDGPDAFPGPGAAAARASQAGVLSPASAAPLADRTRELADSLPGQLHLQGLVDLTSLLRDFPTLAREGFLAGKMDELTSRGFPDPRTDLEGLALGAMFDDAGVSEAMALGVGRGKVVPLVRQVAASRGIPLTEESIEGIPFVRGEINGKTSQFADLAPGIAFVAYDSWNEYRLAPLTMATLRGQNESFFHRHQRRLEPGTYLTARLSLDETTRDTIANTSVAHLAHIPQASLDLVREGNRIRVEVLATATGSIKASLAAVLLERMLGNLASQYASIPAVSRLLGATKVERDGATLRIRAEAEAGEFQAGAQAVEKLVVEMFRERHPGTAD